MTQTLLKSQQAFGGDGWQPANETWEYVSVDDPTGVFRVNADVKGKYSAGMRIKFTNGGNVIYGIITVVGSYSGGYTSITFLHQIDPTDSLALVLMANSAITVNYYSTQKAPYGFNLSPDSWSKVLINDTADRTQANPTAGTWYNLSSLSGSLPIGYWNLSYDVSLYFTAATAIPIDEYVTLSTGNNSETNKYFTSNFYCKNLTEFQGQIHRSNTLSLTTKTTYYLNAKCTTASVTGIFFIGTTHNTVVKAICAYL